MDPHNITSLPRDVILNIFSFLDIKEAVKTSRVSTIFKQVVDEICNAKLINFYNEIGEKIKEFPQNPRQEIIKMMKNKDRLDEIMCDFFKCGQIKELDTNPNFLSERDLDGNTLLHSLASIRRLRGESALPVFMEAVLENGGKLCSKNCEGMTPLHIAASLCDGRMGSLCIFPYLVKEGLERGFDFNQKDNYGRTVLHLVAAHFYYDLGNGIIDNVKFLIDRIPKDSLDLNVKDGIGHTPFAYAILHNNVTAAKTLRKAGAE